MLKEGGVAGGSGGSGEGGLLENVTDLISSGASTVGGGATRAGSLLGKAAGFIGKNAGKLGAIGGVAMGAYDAYSGWNNANEQQQAGLITEDEADIKKTSAVTGGVGGAAGAWGGAATGAAIGSVVPVVGTAIGGLVGGTLGYMGGSALGEKVGEYGSSAYKGVKNWVGGAADRVGNRFNNSIDAVGGAFGSAKDWIIGKKDEAIDTFNRGTGGTLEFQNRHDETARRMEEQNVQPFTEEANKIQQDVQSEILAKDPKANRFATTAVASSEDVQNSSTENGSRTKFNKSVSAEKSVLGSTMLGSLFSAKGLETGSFHGHNSDTVDSDKGTTNTMSEMFGRRVSGGLFGRDTYIVNDPYGDEKQVTKEDYMKMQEMVNKGNVAGAQDVLADAKAPQPGFWDKFTGGLKTASGVFSNAGSSLLEGAKSVGSDAITSVKTKFNNLFGTGRKDVTGDNDAMSTMALGAQVQNIDALKSGSAYADVDPETAARQQAVRDKYEAGVADMIKRGYNENWIRGKQNSSIAAFFGMKQAPDDSGWSPTDVKLKKSEKDVVDLQAMYGDDDDKPSIAKLDNKTAVPTKPPAVLQQTIPDQTTVDAATAAAKNITITAPAPTVIQQPSQNQVTPTPFSQTIRNVESSLAGYVRSRYVSA